MLYNQNTMSRIIARYGTSRFHARESIPSANPKMYNICSNEQANTVYISEKSQNLTKGRTLLSTTLADLSINKANPINITIVLN